MRPQAQALARGELDALSRQELVARKAPEPRVCGGEVVGDRLVFLFEDAAGGIDEPSPRLHQGAGRSEDRTLLLRELADGLRSVAPFEVGIAPQRAEAAARRVDQDSI